LRNWSAWLPKKYKVILDPDSKEMFSGHVRFLKRDSPNAAHRLVLSYKKSIARIADNPFQFPIADELDIMGIPPDTYRKCLFGGHYKALFRLEGKRRSSLRSLIPARRTEMRPARSDADSGPLGPASRLDSNGARRRNPIGVISPSARLPAERQRAHGGRRG
jgi:plasmid stabilization system protein ParE